MIDFSNFCIYNHKFCADHALNNNRIHTKGVKPIKTYFLIFDFELKSLLNKSKNLHLQMYNGKSK